MHSLIQHHEVAAAFVARVFLGLLFFFQGFDAVFRLKMKNVVQTVSAPLEEKGFPSFMVVAGTYFTSYAELICGFLLVIGFVKYYAMYFLGLDLIIASIAFGSLKPMWDMQFVFPRLVLLAFLLVLPSEWDMLSVDYYWSLIHFIKTF